MPLTIKICGLRDPAALDAALDAGADMVGFVVFPPSPRHLPLADGPALAARVERRARKVALTVDADDAALAAVIQALNPDMLQLHGAETPDRVRAVRARFGLPVMKALAIAARDDLPAIAAFDGVSDLLLLDARAPAGANRPGGNGAAFDWSLVSGLTAQAPWLLAGGLNSANVDDALRVSGAPGIDVSSGVERTPGVKDPGEITRFIAAARAASDRRTADRLMHV